MLGMKNWQNQSNRYRETAITRLCLNRAKTSGLGKMAIVLGNYLKSQQKRHPDHKTDGCGLSEDKV